MKRRRLSHDEKELWRRFTAGVTPIAPHRAHDDSQSGDPIVGGSEKKAAGRAASGGRSAVGVNAPSEKRRPERAAAGARDHSAWNAGDPKRDRLAAARRLPIDRTIDLHGLTQVEAERALAAFVRTAYADECRCLLVITGKGGFESASADRDVYGQRRRGVLRERVRDWVDGPLLRPFVARLASARPKDGGAGAYYLHLKKKR